MNLPLTIKKTISRLIAVQTIYADDIRSHDRSNSKLIIDMLKLYNNELQILDSNISSESIDADEKHLSKVVVQTIENQIEIDKTITKFLTKDWTIDKLSGILRSIIRAAVCELQYFENIPHKVIINEYTNLTSDFYSELEIGFVNGILNKISLEIRNI